MPLHIHSPLILSSALSTLSKKNIWLKMEALQPSGSFKIRGIGLACETYVKQGAKRFVSSSGGNAGLAVATAGKRLGIPALVVVPKTTSTRAIELLQLEEANVVVYGSSWQEANDHALSLMQDTDAFLHPFDNPLLWKGHSSMIDEVISDGFIPDAVVLSVGGGGLLSGVVEGLNRNNLNHVPIIAVETEGMASFNAAIQHNEPISLPQVTGVATSLGAKKVCNQAFHATQTNNIKSILVSDTEAIDACQQFLYDHRVVVEPACGASLASIYQNKHELNQYKDILVIVCGGSTISAQQLLKM